MAIAHEKRIAFIQYVLGYSTAFVTKLSEAELERLFADAKTRANYDLWAINSPKEG